MVIEPAGPGANGNCGVNVDGGTYSRRNIGAPSVRRTVFEELFADHYRAVERYVRYRFGDADVADVLSATFTIAWRKLGDCPPDATRGWLIGIARNTARNSERSHRRRVAAEAAVPASRSLAAELYDVSVPADTAARLARALQALSKHDREVVELAAFCGLTGSDLGAALGVSGNAANVRLHRARQRLSAVYRNQEEMGR